MKQWEEDRYYSNIVKNSWISQTVKEELSEVDKLHRQMRTLRTFWELESCKDKIAWEQYQ